MPIILYVVRHACIDPTPMLFAQYHLANLLSMMVFLVGNPTNIVVGDAATMTDVAYLEWMALPLWLAGFRVGGGGCCGKCCASFVMWCGVRGVMCKVVW